MSSDAADTKKLKVFISYSRKDLEFADQLVAVLKLQDFQPIIDRVGIHAAEKWEERLGQLILQSDIVVFVLSPDSAASKICGWEVEEAIRRGKQVIPILCRPLGDQQPHERLRDLNYIHFYADPDMPGSGFGTGQVRLIDALSVDVNWLREQTRLGELAERWQQGGQPNDLLVRGTELSGYQTWRDNKPDNAPELTPEQRNFLAASEEAQAARESTQAKRLEDMAQAQKMQAEALEAAQLAQQKQAAAAKTLARRTVMGLIGAAVLVVVAGGTGYFAYEQKQEAKLQTHINNSKYLARTASNQIDKGDYGTALALTLEAMPDFSRKAKEAPVQTANKQVYWQSAQVPLDQAIRKLREKRVLKGHERFVNSVAISPDGQRIISGSEDNTVRIWDASSGKQLQLLKGHRGALSPALR